MYEVLRSLIESTEFWATIAGAIVGGAISLAIQMISFREGRLIRQKDRKRQDEALAHSLVFKCMRILSNIHLIYGHFIESDARAATDGVNVEPWAKYLPIANPPEPINFSADEMGMLLGLKDAPVFNAMMDMDVRHNSIVATLNAFNTSRIALTDTVSSVGFLDAGEGQQLSHSMPQSAAAMLRPKMIEVNTLAEGLREISAAALQDSKRNLNILRDLLEKKILFSYKLKFLPEV
jgi:hypothetical protein